MTFDDLVASGEDGIERLIGRQEDLSLEFKSLDPREPIFVDGAITRVGKKHLAKEASAFANSAGGLIIFGVDCRATDGIDRAEKLTPIPSIQRAETSVRDATSELLQPRHGDIRVAAIHTKADSNAGYILIDVPRSDRRPHRSEATDQKQYFKRIGSRSYPMEHYDIEDAFQRASSPVLELHVSFSRHISMRREAEYKMILALSNVGNISAKSISLQIWDTHGHVFGTDTSPSHNTVSSHDGRRYIAAPADFVIHPSEKRRFHSFAFRAKKLDNGSITFMNSPIDKDYIQFSYAIGAENMRVTNARMILTRDDLEPVLGYFSDR